VLQVDEGQIRQVLINLLRNAREALTSGGHVAVRVVERDDSVELIVDDDGPGIDRETEQRLFEPFFTTKGQGTGLGLAITREIVEAHAGTIRGTRRRPSGTRFSVTLPRAPAQAGPSAPEVLAPRAALTPDSGAC
jgi:signal transduction histidine kinase